MVARLRAPDGGRSLNGGGPGGPGRTGHTRQAAFNGLTRLDLAGIVQWLVVPGWELEHLSVT